jgi:hypothetical protein
VVAKAWPIHTNLKFKKNFSWYKTDA